jgi:hypothetical protein
MIMRTIARWIFAGVVLATPVHAATLTRITALPASDIFSLSAQGDTIVAGTDTSVFVSTDAGANWRASARVTPNAAFVFAVRIHNGTIYAGTSNQGVFVSTDLGTSWSAFNQGLVGGVLNSQLSIGDFAFRGDNLYAGTLGAGVYVRPLVPGGTWHAFGNAFEPNQASDVRSIGVDGSRLIAAAGGNGTVFRRDPADPDWTETFLINGDLAPGLQAQSIVWNGNTWVIGSNIGIFRSATGQEPWAFGDPGLGPLNGCPLAVAGRKLFAAFNAVNHSVIAVSDNDAAGFVAIDDAPLKLVFALAVSRGNLYAARRDGLFRVENAVPVTERPLANVHFALVGPQPVHDRVRFQIESRQAGPAAIDILDVAGRRVAPTIRFEQPAGGHELSWDAGSLRPGVYLARLTAGDQHSSVRIVHVQ